MNINNLHISDIKTDKIHYYYLSKDAELKYIIIQYINKSNKSVYIHEIGTNIKRVDNLDEAFKICGL